MRQRNGRCRIFADVDCRPDVVSRPAVGVPHVSGTHESRSDGRRDAQRFIFGEQKLRRVSSTGVSHHTEEQRSFLLIPFVLRSSCLDKSRFCLPAQDKNRRVTSCETHAKRDSGAASEKKEV